LRLKLKMEKKHVELSVKDKRVLHELLKKGSMKSRTYKRVIGLLELDKGQTYKLVKSIAMLSTNSLGKLSKRYRTEGLECLYDNPRPGRPIKISQALEDQLTVLSCSEAPDGYSQWSLRLLADKMVELGHCESISHTQVGNVLKKRK